MIGNSSAFDIVIIGDFTSSPDTALRVAGECRVQASMGLRTGLLHLKSARPGKRLLPTIQGLVRSGLAEPVDLSGPVRASLIVAHSPALLETFPANLANLEADRVVLVHDRAPRPEETARMFGLLRGRMSWAPTNRWVRSALEALELPVPMEPVDWRPLAMKMGGQIPARRQNQRFVIGHMAPKDRRQWPESTEALLTLLPADGSMEVHLLGRPPTALISAKALPETWIIHEPGDISSEAFLDGIDVLVHFPKDPQHYVPDATIGAALAAERLVLTCPELQQHLGDGPVYCEIDEAVNTAVALLRGEQRADMLARAANDASFRFSGRFHRERISLLGVTPAVMNQPRHETRQNRPPRALFIASNGVGLGHVTRLLAIASRAAGRFEPVFVAHAQAVSLIRNCGFPVEYIPSLSDTGANPDAWDAWLRTELERLIHAYDAEAIVFDGNNPTLGLVHAALSQPPCRLVWVRRGMNNSAASPWLENSRHFDLIIEPGEIASQRDTGVTAARRHEALVVDPITLLDEADLLDRAAARAALELDPERPAVLVQLGAGAHRDLVALTDTVVKCLHGIEGLQVAIAEWPGSTAPLSLWPGTTVISGFPLSRYMRAFDFAISAAGYNSFHEAVTFRVPTVFVAVDHPAVDDQRARARFAQDMGAALELSGDQLFQLKVVSSVILDPRAGVAIAERCGFLARPNGAGQAADAIGGLLQAARFANDHKDILQ